MLCSIIIRCYNEEKYIGRLLHGITHQSVKDLEILLIDSGSTDSTLSIASKYATKIIYISPEHFSFGRALNIGCEKAKGRYYLFISAHCYPVYDDWLEQIIKPFSNQNVALVYGKQRGTITTKFSEEQIFEKWFPNKSNYKQNYPFCNNANAAIRADLWKTYKFNELLTGLEDIDWAFHQIKSGYTIAYNAGALIIHQHEESWSSIRNRYFREGIAMKNIFPHQKFSVLSFFQLFFVNVLSDTISALKKNSIRKNLAGIIKFRFFQFWGTYRGFATNKPLTHLLKRRIYYPNSLINLDDEIEVERIKHIIDYSKK